MNHSFGDLIGIYEEHLRSLHRKGSTLKNYRICNSRFTRFCEQELGLKDPRQLEAAHFAAFIQQLKEQPFTALTLYACQRNVRTWLAWLTLHGYLLLDPTTDFAERHPRMLPKGSPSEQQVFILLLGVSLATSFGQRDRAIFELLYGTGLRVAECSSLDVDHINLTAHELRVERGKGGRKRVVPFGPKLAAILANYLEHVRPHLVRCSGAALWLDRHGHRMEPRLIQEQMRCHCSRLRIKPTITPHALRHAYATHLLAHGAPILALQKLLGHATLTMTSRYVNLVPLDVQQSILENHPRGRRRRMARPPSPGVER